MTSPPHSPAWVDLHVHYLPGIDDGPATFAETLAMLRRAYETGSRVVVATPHLYSFVAERLTPDEVRRTFARTCEELAEAARRPELSFLAEMSFREGAENQLGTELLTDLERQQAVTLDGTHNILVELPPMLPFEACHRALERITGRGYVPVLAHVERYPMLLEEPEALGSLLRLGCVAQVNVDSVTGAGSRRAARRVRRLLRDGVATIVASDGHDAVHRPPDLGAAADSLASEATPGRISEWLREAPARLLRD